jgi:hypothetical protein
MTGKLSRTDDIFGSRFPDVCPKCGAAFEPGFVRGHFEQAHSRSIGWAVRRANERQHFDFAYVAPMTGTSERRWWIVVFDWPYGLVAIKVDEWLIRWAGADPAPEGVFG